MSILKSKTYINTTNTGLVNIIEHNLGGVPLISVTEWDGSNEVYVSLMDARISEAKVLDADSVQVTFASAFQGYVELDFVGVDNPSVSRRLASLEENYAQSINLIESKVSKTQWVQMNTLLSNQIKEQQILITDLQSQLSALKADVDSL